MINNIHVIIIFDNFVLFYCFRFDKNEAITDGVETTDACEISIEVAKAGEKMWSIHKKGHENEDNKGVYNLNKDFTSTIKTNWIICINISFFLILWIV